MVPPPTPFASSTEREEFLAFVERYLVPVQQLIGCFVRNPSEVLHETFVRAHGLRQHVDPNEEPLVWLGRAALHVAAAERARADLLALHGADEIVQTCWLLRDAVGLSTDVVGRILQISARRVTRYADRAVNHVASRIELGALSGTAERGARERLDAVRAICLQSALDANRVEALARRVIDSLESGPATFELASSRLLRAPVPDERPSERDASRASLRDLSTLLAPPRSRSALPRSDDEDSGVVRLGAETWRQGAASPPAPRAAPLVDMPTNAPSPRAELTPATATATIGPVPAAVVAVAAPGRAPSRWLAPLVAALVAASVTGVLARVAIPAGHADLAPAAAAAASIAPTAATATALPTAPSVTATEPPWAAVPGVADGIPTVALPLSASSLAANGSGTSVKNVQSASTAGLPVRAETALAPVTPNGTLDDAMRGAVGPVAAVAEPSAAPSTIPTDAPKRPPQGAVTTALARATAESKHCMGPDDPISHATLTFDSHGVVQRVQITGRALGTPAETCLESTLRHAILPPFTDPDYRATVTIRP